MTLEEKVTALAESWLKLARETTPDRDKDWAKDDWAADGAASTLFDCAGDLKALLNQHEDPS